MSEQLLSMWDMADAPLFAVLAKCGRFWILGFSDRHPNPKKRRG